jgi:hypothetical protein
VNERAVWMAALSIAREILPPERRFVLPPVARDEINSRRAQEFLASFGQLDRIFMQLIVVICAYRY